jgi:hypothetical protein
MWQTTVTVASLTADAGGALVVGVIRHEEVLYGWAVFREAQGCSHEYFQL